LRRATLGDSDRTLVSCGRSHQPLRRFRGTPSPSREGNTSRAAAVNRLAWSTTVCGDPGRCCGLSGGRKAPATRLAWPATPILGKTAHPTMAVTHGQPGDHPEKALCRDREV